MSGIDRYFERYYRKGPRRRPVKIDFCEADVLDVFDEWRRATGVTATATLTDEPDAGSQTAPPKKRGASLPEHLERVLVRLSSLRATGTLGEAADPLVDQVSAELDAARRKSSGLRGDDRRAALERLAALDRELLELARASLDASVLQQIAADADAELAPFRATMQPGVFEAARDRAATSLLRQRLGLPLIAF
jgi:hypothetical protein